MSEEPKQPDITAIKARLAAATPGPYLAIYETSEGITIRLSDEANGDRVYTYATPADIDLFENCYTDIAALLALVERQGQALTGQDREIRRLNDEIDRYRSELGYEE